jgi:hypothetical protein
MTYRIDLAATSKTDIRDQTRWISEYVSHAAANVWLAGLSKTIATQRTRPLRCPVARENERFPEEIRELLHERGGKRAHKHRIIFTLRQKTVIVLYVRHTARDELEP